MLSKLITEEFIQIIDEELSWEDAIKLACKPLLKNKMIEERYVDAMFDMAKRHGPFFDIGKQIAIPHARSEMGVNKTSMSLLRCLKPVYLLDDKDHPIDIFIIIASADNNSHLTALASLSEILISDDLVNELKGLRTVSDIANFFRKEEEK